MRKRLVVRHWLVVRKSGKLQVIGRLLYTTKLVEGKYKTKAGNRLLDRQLTEEKKLS